MRTLLLGLALLFLLAPAIALVALGVYLGRWSMRPACGVPVSVPAPLPPTPVRPTTPLAADEVAAPASKRGVEPAVVTVNIGAEQLAEIVTRRLNRSH